MSALFKSSFGFLPLPLPIVGSVTSQCEYRVGFFVGSSFRCKKVTYSLDVAQRYRSDLLSLYPSSNVKIIYIELNYKYV